MKYLTFAWSVCFACVLYLPLMLLIWFATGAIPPWWVATCLIIVLALVVHLVVLVRQDHAWKSEDVLRPDESMLVHVEGIKKRREDAERYILQSGDEEAVKVLQHAQANFHSYNTILFKGMKQGNGTLKIALGILSGMFGDTVPSEIKDGDVVEAMKKMESTLVPLNIKKQRNDSQVKDLY